MQESPPQAIAPNPVETALQLDRKLAMRLQVAWQANDAKQALALCQQLSQGDPIFFDAHFDSAESPVRLAIHELIDRAVRTLILAPEPTADGAPRTKAARGTKPPVEPWRRMLLPDRFGLFECPGLSFNALWLRTLGSQIPESLEERLDAVALGKIGFKQQALALGRFCVSNDGRAALDYKAIRAVLDPRLLPFFNDWILTVYCLSPLRLAEEESTRNQQAVLEQFMEASRLAHAPTPASSAQCRPAFQGAYWTADSIRPLAEELNGGQMRGLFERFVPAAEEPGPALPELAVVSGTESVIICPNWHDDHVVYRCLSPLTEGLRASGSKTLRVIEEVRMGSHPVASLWGSASIDVPYGDRFVLPELALINRRLREFKLDFAFYPEIVPTNSSAWMATERVARVQATSYGYPVTSGLPDIDFFVGGADVEPADTTGSDYSEQLVLLPGLGVSTTPPPLPSIKRERPIDDEVIHLVATASRQKLGTQLLRAWNEIRRGEKNSTLSLFTNLSPAQAEGRIPAIGRLLTDGVVDLVCKVPREDLINTVADADLYLDAYPFGGFNTLVEVLVCGVPAVTIEGSQARHRFGAAILRRLGLPEFLIAKDYDEYVQAAKRLMQDAGLRQDIRDRIGSTEEVLAKLADPHSAEHFDAAVAWMRAQGPRRSRRLRPVRIEAGEKARFVGA